MLRAFGDSIAHQVPFNAEYRLRTSVGEYRWFEGRGRVFCDPAGQVSHFAGEINDITGRKHAEERLRQAATVFDNTREA